MAEEKEVSLSMSFEPNVIEHLGVKMYSHTVPALAELIANSYDACASKVEISLFNHPHKITIKDDGIGMTFDEINNFYLRIGRNRRFEKQNSCVKRIATGKKGLGKLALFGLGGTFQIETSKNGEKISFKLDYAEIMQSHGAYKPTFSKEIAAPEEHGTTITLTNLKKIQDYPIEEYASSLAKLFNFSDSDFSISINLDGQEPILITNKSKYESLTYEFKWCTEEVDNLFESEFEWAKNISGEIFTTEKPLKNELKGITLFANGRMVNKPEFFIGNESSHFYSYATGYINVDFIDNLDEDLISTDRTSLDWNHNLTIELRKYLAEFVANLERDWRKKKKALKEEKLQTTSKINIAKWFSTIPENIKANLNPIVSMIDDSELTVAEQSLAIENLHKLIPEYPYYHWRHLNPEIQNASEKYYQAQDYYQAFIDAIKRYVANTRIKTGNTTADESELMGLAFGSKSGALLSVTAKKSKKPDGASFTKQTLDSIEEGQKFISMGILSGCRNPISHEEIPALKNSELFTEMDCLDALSIVSHLQRRLDDA